ncbi:MAG: bifunctional aspartate transaminase/aspartate 4-decarboxylase [Verrucomicrobia bacterium]|nr:bifunctional aspartate transaminase/aspartate 4-decarboxylase [Verrucomicrobiota bacterium]MCG2680778.1 bifunctional aspartate transaminase/aspartate 4-decarboxylase [Kiritimatiellia bacterium]MBU4246807.1 bifunctional aspartate transaminase/aspartate 4-decarboxylase [Verrucomicrobiota bacterium]MBU4291028.1 bifunctional aspartate transaminase/aspartate 4-decarboxylase [Verrucomicrobiota bacterium]MBU4429523.1 bifunctional aspartate transaminase/aspartate 4-decarboxylase [Verrucomicrobiota b
MSPSKPMPVSRAQEKALEILSPFELKNNLIQLAEASVRAGAAQMLNAGRGNPNWVCTTPREAFFTLGRFGIEESKRALNVPDTGGMPQKKGIAKRFTEFLDRNPDAPGVKMLRAGFNYGVKQLGFDGDTFVHELTDSIIGDQYPTPDRMLHCTERIVQAYLAQEMCAGRPPKGHYDLFAVEGGTAAMCYTFDSLMVNRLLHRGDSIALGVPTFTPYIEIPELDRFSFRVVEVSANKELRADGTHTWQYTDAEIDKLADRRIKAFFLVNPSNPPSYAMRASSLRRLVKLVKTKRPDLIIITDDVYGTFVPGFRSLMAELPHNTIGVYSYSKHFGCTGWRLGVIAIHQENIFDRMIAKLPAKDRAALNKRYDTLTLTPAKMKFIDRMVADSRSVALNHTAGLSLPQQAQMALFSLFALTDSANSYKTICQLIVRRRYKALWDGLGLPFPADDNRAGYYCELDLMVWAEHAFGAEFAKFLKKNYEPVDVLFRLAEQSGVVLMHGGGFEGPQWSVRVSLANLPEEAYPKIGHYLVEASREYVREWQASKR